MHPRWPIGQGNRCLDIISIDELHLLCLALGAAGSLIIAIRVYFQGKA